MDINRLQTLAGIPLTESTQTPNPHAKKQEGERKVKETADYIIFFNKDV